MSWTESRYWKALAFFAVLGLFAVAWAIAGRPPYYDLPVVQPAPAENILVVPEAAAPQLQLMTSADNGYTLIWWRFKKDRPETIDMIETKTFRMR